MLLYHTTLKTIHAMVLGLLLGCGSGLFPQSLLANVAGGGTNGPNVTLTDNGSTVTLANGIVSLVCTKSGATINAINYTYNNGGGSQTRQLLSGGTDGGKLYWENSTDEGLTFTYSLITNPTNNGGNYAEISMFSTSVTGDELEVHFSMLRGSTGFYTTAIYSHESTDGAFGMGECRDNIYAGATFNWMCVDAQRNRLMEVSGGSAIAVQGAPKEVSLWTNGIYQGQYEDKYKYSADLGGQQVWGWGSVGTGGLNVGLWNISASAEYYNGGPLKRELMEHIGTTILNMLNGGHYGMGSDGNFTNAEVWEKVYGPYFIYCNNVTNTLTGTNQAAQALYADARAQGAAEQSAWPYDWFTNANYAPAANRGAVTGQFAITDSGNPNATAAGLWVGLIQQPATSTGIYDFQQWMKPYQFWTQTDANGNFTLTNVIAGSNYTLYAFGPGTPDTFLSQNQTGGAPPLIVDLPAQPFAVTVAGGAATNLGTVYWTPTRQGATVFEIGYPDRKGDKFRHGDDYWVGDLGPSPSAPSPIWSKWLEFPFDFPNGLNYVVGQSRWTTDWNFIQPVTTDSQGNYDASSSTITFTLPAAPANGAKAVIYLGLASDYYSAVIVTVNGSNLGNVGGVTGAPNSSIPNTGYYAGYADSDTSIREGNNAAFSDERLTFPASLLQAGVNTINIGIRQVGGSYFADHLMYDYIRLELPGYVPPAPGSVAAYPGNNGNLVCWPVTPGATSYNILRSSNPMNGFVTLTNGVIGPVCGSGANNAVYFDAAAANGSTNYYEVCSVNPTGVGSNSPASAMTVPSPALATTAPAAPGGLIVTSSGHQSVTLSWNASAGASFYSVWRSTLANSGGGSSNTLSTIILNNAVTNTTYTDTSPTDGGIYSYFVAAIGPGGTSAASTPAVAVPLPAPPTALPVPLLASFVTTNVVLTWAAVPGAVGYLVARATSASGPYVYLQTVTETTYTDVGLSTNTIYYYRVAAVNGGGVTANVTDAVNSQQTYPPSLTANGGNAAIILNWSPATGATSYTVKRGTSSANETTTVVTGYAGTTYTDTGLSNGVTYYYVVTATGAGGASGNSPEASATPFANINGIWTGLTSGIWGAVSNWSGGEIASGPSSTADFSTLGLPTNLTVTLDSARSVGTLKFGDQSSTYNWTIAGSNTLTFGANPNIEVVNQAATLSVPIAGAAGLTKSGLGTLTLGGATNTFTGGANVSSGNLTLNYAAANSPVPNLIPAANALTLSGGALQMIASSNAVNTQTFAACTLNAGGAIVSAAPVMGANLPVVNLGTVKANAGGVIEFIGPATLGAGGASVPASATLTTTTNGTGAFLGGSGSAFFSANYATVGLYDFAATAGLTSPYTVVGGSQMAGFYSPAGGDTAVTGGNLDVTNTITGWSAQPYLTTMRFNTHWSGGMSVSLTNSFATLTLADILVTPNVGANNVTFYAGYFRPNANGSGPFVVWQNNLGGELVLNTSIENSKNSTSFYAQAGAGTVWINNAADSYTGASYLNGGVTLIGGDAALGAAAAAATVYLNGGTIVANSTCALDNGGANPRPITLLGNGGGLAAAAGNTLTVDGVIGSAAGAGPLTIGLAASSANNTTPGLLPGTGAGTANATPVYALGLVVVTNANYYTGGTFLQSGTLNFNGLDALGGANYGGLTFNGGTLQYSANFTGNNGSADLTSIGAAGITLAAGGGTIDLNGNSVNYAGSVGNNGRGALTVKSTLAGGVLTLSGANTYAGATLITNAALVANNLTGSATGAGNVTVQNGGSLSGAGALTGSVTVAAGGRLLPGNGFGTLTLGNNLALAAGSTTWIQVQHLPLTNSAISLSGALNAGGTLMITNAGATALANGDQFQILGAAGYAGAFSRLVWPALATNLLWNTNLLMTSGTISVVALTPPTLAAIQFNGSDLTITGSGGAGGWPYLVLATTNLAAAVWTPVTTNQFDGQGNFTQTLTNAASMNPSQVFYKLQLQ